MGKLNYSARKIDGGRVVQVAVKDLKKRITTSSGLRATSRDPTLEIDVSDKNITDAAFNDFAKALLECMHFRDAEHLDGAAKITELHLSGNQLTVKSLEMLTEVVALSGADLREVDFSRNRIEVRDQEQKRAWLGFLRAFDGCCVLRKVNLSENVLGIGGIEMLARAYMQSDLDFAEGEDDDVLENDDDDEDVVDDMLALKINGYKEGGRSKKSPSKAKAKQNGAATSSSTGKAVSEMKRYSCTRGLRSVPFIIISNTSMTTGAAVHLASMVLIHKAPEKLLAFLPGSRMPALPNDQGRCNGLIYLPNDRIGDLGQKLLDSAETLRRFTAAMDPEEDQLHRESKLPLNLQGVNLMDLMEQRRQHTKLNVDYNRIAKRARLETLRTEGVHSSDIWSSALKMITYSRTLLMDGAQRGAGEPESEDDQEAPAVDKQAAGAESATQVEESPSDAGPSDAATYTCEQSYAPAAPATGSENYTAEYYAKQQRHLLPSYPINWSAYQTPTSMAVQHVKPNSLHSSPETLRDLSQYPQQLYSSLFNEPPTGPFQPGAAAFDENFPALGSSNGTGPVAQPPPEQLNERQPKDNTPATPPQHPRKWKKQCQRKSGHGHGHSRSQSSVQRNGSCEGTSGPSCTNGTGTSQQNGHQQSQNQNLTQVKRDNNRSWFSYFSFRANRAVVAFAADADGVLTPAQQDRIVRYATDWRSIEAEMRAQGAEEYQQIWKLIETAGCFTYSCS